MIIIWEAGNYLYYMHLSSGALNVVIFLPEGFWITLINPSKLIHKLKDILTIISVLSIYNVPGINVHAYDDSLCDKNTQV
jgi:hypothetical protein